MDVGRAVAAVVTAAAGVAVGEGVGVTRVITCPQPASIKSEARNIRVGAASFSNFKLASQVVVNGLGQIIPQGGARPSFFRASLFTATICSTLSKVWNSAFTWS